MKITPTGVAEACKSLQSNRFYPISDMYSANPIGQGTGSAASDNKHKGKVLTPPPPILPLLLLASTVNRKFFRLLRLRRPAIVLVPFRQKGKSLR
jgi:hypothetical protein